MYKSYLEHVAAHGEKDTTLDRKDNDGNYCLKNCKWSTRKEQQRNMRSNKTYTLSEIIEALGLSDTMVRTRLKRGANLGEALRSHCKYCDGKGYATVNDQWIGHDTDTDIGSSGGTVRGGNPNAMKYCTCERGKQLEGLVAKEVAAAQSESFIEGWQAAVTDTKGWIERTHLGKGFDGDDRWEHCASEIVLWLDGQLAPHNQSQEEAES